MVRVAPFFDSRCILDPTFSAVVAYAPAYDKIMLTTDRTAEKGSAR